FAFRRYRLAAFTGVVLRHGEDRRQIRSLNRRIEHKAVPVWAQAVRRQRSELETSRRARGPAQWIADDCDVCARGAIQVLELRLFAGRPGFERREPLPHWINAEIETRRMQCRIGIKCRKARPDSNAGFATSIRRAALLAWAGRSEHRIGCLRILRGDA